MRALHTTKATPPRLGKVRLAAMIEEATVDCHGESEQVAGWFTVIEQNLVTPFATAILGVAVTVQSVELTRDERIVAICARGRERQPIAILDLPLAAPLPRGAEWIEAYRHWRGAEGGRDGAP